MNLNFPFKRVDIHVQNAANQPVENVDISMNLPNTNLSLGPLQANVGSVSYPSATNSEGNTSFYLFPATYNFTATPPSGSGLVAFSLNNVSINSDQTEIISLQFSNLSPTIGIFTPPSGPVEVNTAANITATFTDTNVTDTHTAVWSWGDNSTSNGTIAESNGSGTASGTHIYTTAGVYTVGLTVTDNHNASDNKSYQYIVVYDPNAGFMTVSGKYDSLAGWDLQNTQATGEVKLGIQGKYTNNNTTPTGNSKLNFNVGNIDFNSGSYQWLVVNSYKGYLMGTGTINGTGSYSIFISVIDGDIAGSGGQDLLRIRITDNSTQDPIYDTQPNTSLLADPTTSLSSGSIKIH